MQKTADRSNSHTSENNSVTEHYSIVTYLKSGNALVTELCLNLHIPALFEKSTSMQIILFLPHYQLVYANFDFSSFSLISYFLKGHLLQCKRASFTLQKSIYYFAIVKYFLQKTGVSYK